MFAVELSRPKLSPLIPEPKVKRYWLIDGKWDKRILPFRPLKTAAVADLLTIEGKLSDSPCVNGVRTSERGRRLPNLN